MHKLFPAAEARQKVRAMAKPSVRPNLPKTIAATTASAEWSGSDDELTAAMEKFESTHPSGMSLSPFDYTFTLICELCEVINCN